MKYILKVILVEEILDGNATIANLASLTVTEESRLEKRTDN